MRRRPRADAAPQGAAVGLAVICALLVALVSLTATAAAQDLPIGPPPRQEPAAPEVTAETLEALLQDIEDPERREQLVERLRALIRLTRGEPETEARPGFVDEVAAFLQAASAEAGRTVARVVDQVAQLPARLRSLRASFADPDARGELLRAAGATLGILALALLAAALVRVALRRPRASLVRERTPPLARLPRAWRGALHLLLELVPPAVLLAVAWAALSAVDPPRRTGAVVLALATGLAASRVLRRVVDAVLAPRTPAVRVLAVDDDAARRLARALSRVGSFGLLGIFVIAATRAAGAEAALLEALEGLYALSLLVLTVALVLRFRHWPGSGASAADVAAAFDAAGAPPSETPAVEAPAGDGVPDLPPTGGSRRRGWRGALRRLARLWWIVVLVYVLGLYALWVSGIEGAFGAAVAATGLTLLYAALGVAAHLLGAAVLRELGLRAVRASKRYPSVRRRIPRYLAVARLTLGALVTVVTAGFVFDVWGIRPLSTLQSLVLQTLLSVGVGVLAVILLAFAVVDLFTALTENYLLRKQRLREDSSKLRTLVPLSQKFIKLVVFVVATVTVLGQIGVSIGPLLASIGVVGLAVGFGAQTLVKDVITGVFILLEDAVSVGDVIQIGDTAGAVEAINIRTIKLRDLSGVVHTIPYSSVTQLANLTKDFSYYAFSCAVAYREDVDEVIELLHAVGAELQGDRQFASRLLGPIEIFGLDRFEDSAVVVTGRLKTRPSEQWSVGREFNRRLKQALDAAGIEMPFPQRTIWFGEDKAGAAPALRVAQAPDGGVPDRSADGGPSRP